MKKSLCAVLALALLGSASAHAGSRKKDDQLFTVTNLVADTAGIAKVTDPDLINPWGIAQFPGGDLWVSDNHTDLSTLYDPNTGAKSGLVVTIPLGAPTGQVAVPSGNGFVVTEGSSSGESSFIFNTESGAIEGWSSGVDLNNAIVAYDGRPNGSAYKGLAYDPVSNHLFSADFHNNQVEIIDNTFKKIGSFTDPNLPKNYAPFNVTLLNGKLYVAFALREKKGDDEVDGKSKGYIDVFSTDGTFQQTLIANGVLNAPWGTVIAPANFGKLAGSLLVGNFGDGHINAFNIKTGKLIDTLHGGKKKKDLEFEGLWMLDDTGNGSITISAGGKDENHGLIALVTPQ